VIVLGIDPGMANTGFGAVEVDGSRMRAREHGELTTSARAEHAQRLAAIYERVDQLLEAHRPDAVAIEDLYVGRNPRTILAVGQARGAVLAACGRAGVEVCGDSPAQIKTSVCGYGRAEKQQVMSMVSAMLSLREQVSSDHASDALAAAICHARMSHSRALVAGARR
jgi:crossover junction endodeoxyribonuclease RuvC